MKVTFIAEYSYFEVGISIHRWPYWRGFIHLGFWYIGFSGPKGEDQIQ